MIDKVREIVKQESDEWNWNYHIVIVVDYAKLLAKKLDADEELVELGALLHDIGRVKFGGKDHDVTGIPEAERILKKLNYPEDVIEEVKHCVESHRGSKDIMPKTVTAKIIANADAMSHFDIIPALFEIILKKKGDFEEAFQFLYDKIGRDWNKKLTIPEAKEMVKDKYNAFKLLFDSMKEHMK